MNKSQNPSKTFSDGLWIPAVLIAVAFALSIVFMINTVKNYKKPRHLLIKPSSVETPEEISASLYKALYPLKIRNFGLETLVLEDDELSSKVVAAMAKDFPRNDNIFKLSTYKVSLDEAHDNNKMDCRNTALFNLKRKPDRKWKKKIYFTVCTEETNQFSLFYTQK